jgi:AraC-like DNA-binding protein
VIYETYIPSPPFDRFIQNIWYWESSDAPGHVKDTIMASGRMGLMINLLEDELRWYDGEKFQTKNRLRGIGLCGTQSRHFAIDALQQKIMGVQFRPGGTCPFFGPLASDFEDRHISLADFWGGNRAHSLHMQLIETPGIAAKFRIVLDALVENAARDFAHHPAVSQALAVFNRKPMTSRVAGVAVDADVSQKKLIRLFSQQVGCTPKLYLRVTRFQRLLDRVWNAPHVDWAQIAAAHGYYDQPHLIRDFREFSGFTPSEYLARRGQFQQHVPLPA